MVPIEQRGCGLRTLRRKPHVDSVSKREERQPLTVLQMPLKDGHEEPLQGTFALREDGKVDIHIPKHMQPLVGPKFVKHLRDSFKRAYLARIQEQPAMIHRSRVDDVPDYIGQPASDSTYDDEESLLDEPIRFRKSVLCNACDNASCDRFSGSMHGIDNKSSRPDRISRDSDIRNSTVLTQNMKRLLISNEAQVVAFLEDRLERIQQLTDKKIAKAWIKGICPKKQARFPYQNAKRERDEGLKPDIPPWWPIDLCDFKEPDHIQKEPRKRLLIHLLRLRPSPEELVEWNGETFDAHKTHQRRGWTAFLQELAPIETVATVDNQKPDKVEKRRQYLKDLYTVAEMEEDHQRSLRTDGVGMDIFYDYPDDDRPVKSINKAKRQRREGSIALSHGEVSSTRSLSATPCEGLVEKRRRLNSDTEPVSSIKADGLISREIPNSEDSTMEIEVRPPEPRESLSIPKEVEGIVNVDEDVMLDHKSHDLGNAASVNGTANISLQVQRQACRQNFAAPNECNLHGSEAQWRTPANTSMTVPFGPAVSDMVSFDQFQSYPSSQPSYIGRNDGAPGPYLPHTHLPVLSPSSSFVQMHKVVQIPQPQFSAIPNTPIFSSSSLICENGITPASEDVFSSSVASPIAALPFHVPQGQINCNYQFTSNSANDFQHQPYGLQAQEVYHNVYDGIPLQHRPPYQSESQCTSLPWLCQHPDEKAIGFHNRPLATLSSGFNSYG